MKKFGKALTAALCCALALVMLAACGSSSIGGIQKRFEDAGWTFEKGASATYGEIGSATLYGASDKDNPLKAVLVLELNGGSDFAKFISELENNEKTLETTKALFKDAYKLAQKSGLINGNCMLIFPLGIINEDAQKLFKGE